jgi:hypothetical protein
MTYSLFSQPWSYGADNFIILKKVHPSLKFLLSPFLTLFISQYIALRYQLIPYIKSLFQNLQKSGQIIMRPLYLDFSKSDEFVRNATKSNDPSVIHQFMFGISLPLSLRFFFFCPILKKKLSYFFFKDNDFS